MLLSKVIHNTSTYLIGFALFHGTEWHIPWHYSPERNDFYASSNNLAWTTAAIIDPSVSTSLLDDHESHCMKQWLYSKIN